MPSSQWGSARSLETFLSPVAQSSSTHSESKHRFCLPVHCYLPPHNSGPIHGVQCRDSCNQNLRIHKSNSPRSLGGQWKRSLLLPGICSDPMPAAPWQILSCPVGLTGPLQYHRGEGRDLLTPCSLLQGTAIRLHTRSAFGPLWGGQTTGFLRMQRTIQAANLQKPFGEQICPSCQLNIPSR